MLIHVQADYGLFTRPEFPCDRVSYPVAPYSTLRGLLETFYWKQGVVWDIRRVFVLSEVQYVQIMGNERLLEGDSERTQRRNLFLRAPSYVIDAHPVGQDYCQTAKSVAMAHRWLSCGRTRQGLFLGTRECLAHIRRPTPDFEARALRVNRRLRLRDRMPAAILYSADGKPIGTEWGDYTYDPTTGAYSMTPVRS